MLVKDKLQGTVITFTLFKKHLKLISCVISLFQCINRHLVSSVDSEVVGLNPGRTNSQDLKRTEDEGVAFAMTSANG